MTECITTQSSANEAASASNSLALTRFPPSSFFRRVFLLFLLDSRHFLHGLSLSHAASVNNTSRAIIAVTAANISAFASLCCSCSSSRPLLHAGG